MPQPDGLRIVYIVDEDVPVREALARLIDSSGLEARPCTSLEEFLQQAHGIRVACVLLDVTRAHDSDLALRTALQSVASKLPVIGLSSSDDPAVRHLARDLGVRSFFQKPVDGAALLDSIDWLMHGDWRGKGGAAPGAPPLSRA
ncbi:response regulator [Variovorax dokdonensis]|uniref:Response regulator n=1 Tax=Variovorax dokdonensis TaxID=344883 RepID=A0ABT7NGP3_9BURK|nr:response regulator [Variovorax dokdonensis]MDM0047091.1 response regulator [Variovorax dokdonensis]